MAITVYKSTDADAPVLNGVQGSLIDVLDACLTTGYGATPSSGWTQEYVDTNTAVYRMQLTDPDTDKPTTGMYLRVDDTNSTVSRVTAYRSMSGVDTGTGKFPNDSQVTGGFYVTKSFTSGITPRPWVIIADHRFLYLWTFPKSTTLGNLGLIEGNANSFLMFGDIISTKANDATHCIIHGNHSADVNTSVSAAPYTYIEPYTYIATNFTGLDTSFPVKKVRIAPAGIGSIGYIGQAVAGAYPDPVTGTVNLFPYNIVESTAAIRGRIPGFYEPHGGTLVGQDFDTIQGANVPLSSIQLTLVPLYFGDLVGRVAIQTSGYWDNI